MDRSTAAHRVKGAPPTGDRASNGPRRPNGLLVAQLQALAGNRAVAGLMADGSACTRCHQPVAVQRSLLGDLADATGLSGVGERVGQVVDAARAAANSAVDAVTGAVAGAASYVGDRVGDALDLRQNEALRDYEEERRDRDAWIARGPRAMENLVPPTGIGGFAAGYDPSSQVLLVRLAGGVDFKDGMRLEGGRAIAVQPKAGPFADRINAMPADQRAAAVASFQWTGGEKAQFLERFRSQVESAWSGQHPFHCSKKYWEDLGATTSVTVHVHAGPKVDDEHMSLTTYKVPDDFIGGVGVVKPHSGLSATDNEMLLNSNDVLPRNDNLLRWSATCDDNAATMDAENTTAVRRVATTFQSGGARCRSCGREIGASGARMEISVQGQGTDPEANARERYQRVVAIMTEAGFTNADSRLTFAYGGVGRAVSMAADSGVAQVVAAHEAGHMFGLGDEYAVQEGSNITGTGAAAGDPAEHDQLVRDMGLPGAVFENNDNIMSLGTVVRPQHYATFFWALKEVSDLDDWALGPPRPVVPPGPGDFPASATPPGTALA